ncbi:SDR family oxidoreductase [Aeromicrobium chenweiae]|uniref:3-beta hydroxysteroid dehydrogenase n=1 Tax=Aeromicrobium chenweiae TaxID=2079793 RepID=A0A2S0WM75_9ACTN|nr:NAD(P)H-binding protein [Aeromicrobium chenweiae]AWB92407.1 3-beta hydroxysteroid dehydrogenase [Aeromicrobium chenweiae]TGN31306.1 3-beta hydroxysteroid dehydrogenase [Aeromicrobium chenweiae]
MRIAVAGGTGLVGTLVVEHLRSGGHEPVVLARGAGVDLVSGAGLDTALAGVEAVVDVSNVTTLSRRTSRRFFGAATTHLLEAEGRAGVPHHVVLSIVGVDRVDSGYYEGKRVQEKLVAGGAVPWTIVRATQFHEFAGQVLDQVPGPVAVVPRMRTQPMAAREVAETLAAHALAEPAKRVLELAGPKEEDLGDMARRLLAARGQHRRVLSLRLPARGTGAMASGALLPRCDGPRGRQTYDEWLSTVR